MWSLIVIQWRHVFLGIFWFGSTLYLDFVVIPAVMTLPLDQQRTVSKPLTIFSDRVLIPAAILVIAPLSPTLLGCGWEGSGAGSVTQTLSPPRATARVPWGGERVIALGLIRGIVFGPVRSLDILFGTAYGITFLIASLAAVATFLWGHFAVGRAARHLEAFPLTDVMKSGGTVAVAFAAQIQRVKLLALLELLGFFIIFTCMILMRFGL